MSRTTVSLEGERVGIFAIDGGRTTGVCAGAVTLEGSVKEMCDRDPLNVWQIDCHDHNVLPFRAEVAGAEEIAQEWLEFSAEWTLSGIPATHQFFIHEDFVINRNPRSWKREGVSPIRVNSLVMGILVSHRTIQWVAQQPSDAMARWTDARLKRSNLWTTGLEHGRVATKHVALWIARQF